MVLVNVFMDRFGMLDLRQITLTNNLKISAIIEIKKINGLNLQPFRPRLMGFRATA